jgi:outer membrane murein-binding lipoprotein Lpp
MTAIDPVPGRSGAGFILLLAAVSASVGFTFGTSSAPTVDPALHAELARMAAERDRLLMARDKLDAELQSAREETGRTRQMLEQVRRDLAAAQTPKVDPPSEPAASKEPSVQPPVPRRPAPRPARAPSAGPQP